MNIGQLQIAWADSRGKTIVVLLILLVATFFHQFRTDFLLHVATAIILTIAFDSFRGVSLSSIVTGLLIGLVFDPLSWFIPTAAACLLASVSKNYLGKGNHKHIFNPAAFGIVVSSIIFNRPVSWWGVSWGMLPVVIIGIGMLPILWKLRRQWMPLTFLAVYFLITRQLPLDGTVFLFAFVMLPEPKTAPMRGKWIWGWGLLGGFFVFIQQVLGIAIVDPLLLALLVANGIAFYAMKSR